MPKLVIDLLAELVVLGRISLAIVRLNKHPVSRCLGVTRLRMLLSHFPWNALSASQDWLNPLLYVEFLRRTMYETDVQPLCTMDHESPRGRPT
jgi:hypothetical protein